MKVVNAEVPHLVCKTANSAVLLLGLCVILKSSASYKPLNSPIVLSSNAEDIFFFACFKDSTGKIGHAPLVSGKIVKLMARDSMSSYLAVCFLKILICCDCPTLCWLVDTFMWRPVPFALVLVLN